MCRCTASSGLSILTPFIHSHMITLYYSLRVPQVLAGLAANLASAAKAEQSSHS